MRAATTAAAAAMALLLYPPSAVLAQGWNGSTSSYTDTATGIVFQSFTSPGGGYQAGIVLPREQPSPDFIVQLVAPLNKAGGGWAGIDFGPSMVDYLQIVAWPRGDAARSVVIAPRFSTTHQMADTKPYTASPVTFSAIPKGTFVNSTHISATFVCGGCVNRDSFDPQQSAADKPSFGYAHSVLAVVNPADRDTALSNHNIGGESGTFIVDVDAAKSDQYTAYAKLAQTGGTSSTSSLGAAPTTTPTPTAAAGGSAPPTGTGTSDAAGMGIRGYDAVALGGIVGLAVLGVV